MTPSELLREQARQLLALADALDGAEARPATSTTWIETGVAAKLVGVDPETIRRWAVKHGSGYKTATKWWHDRAAVLSIARDERKGAGNAARDAGNAARAGIHKQPGAAHLELANEDET